MDGDEQKDTATAVDVPLKPEATQYKSFKHQPLKSH